MLKAKKRYILPVLGLKKVLKVLAKNVALLMCKSIFDITFIYSDIPYKCSHVVEIENLKILNIFVKSYCFPHTRKLVFHIKKSCKKVLR
jgi:hypothetical protein